MPAMNELFDSTQPPTWEDLERAALCDPFLHAAVTRVRQGDLSREEALIAVALRLSKLRADMLAKEVERLQTMRECTP